MENVGRDKFWDATKALLIFTVVLGHTLEINLDNRINLALYNTIYTFHMPLFVFLSGYFSKKYNDISSFWSSSGKILETCLVFQILSIIIEYFFYNIHFLFTLLIPKWTVWYLVSLFWWKCLLQIRIPLIEINWKMTLFFCVCIGLIVGFIPIGAPLSFQRTFSMLPYFLFGYYAKNKNLEIKKHLPNVFWGIFGLLMFYIFFFIINENLKNILHGVSTYNTIRLCVYRFVWYIIAILLSSCFLICVNKMKCNNLLLYIGRNTLFLYVYHTFFVRILKYFIPYFSLPDSIPFVLIYSVTIFFVVVLLSHNRALKILLNPITFLRK